MCYSPKVSLITALIEFVISIFIFIRIRKNKLIKFIIPFILLLGSYQLTEFLLCTTNDPQLWGTLGFMSYTFLPALGLHFSITYTDKKFPNYLLYFSPVIFSLIAVMTKNFIVENFCSTIFVEIQTAFFQSNAKFWPMFIYWIYYFGFILVATILIFRYFLKAKTKKKRYLSLLILFTVIISLVPAILLITVFPVFKIMFPSIYCEFSLLYAISAFVAIYYDERV